MAVNDVIRGIRNRLGLTQLEFARHCGISLPTVRNLEQGRRTPRWATVEKIFKATGTHLEQSVEPS
jgi:transcriptional regulator with XRE-family HTH domain